MNEPTPEKGRKLTEEHRKKLSNAKKGKLPKNFYEMQKLGWLACKGKPTWSKGLKLGKNSAHSLRMTGKKHTEEHNKKIGKSIKKALYEGRMKMPNNKGENHPNWKGGITSINKRLRNLFEIKLWRKSVFEKDNYICVWGGKEHGDILNADHIKPFAFYPKLRLELNNGQILCKECHAWKTKMDLKIYMGKVLPLNFI